MTDIALRHSDKQIAFLGSLAEVDAQCEALHELDKKTETRRLVLIVATIAGAAVALIGFALEAVAAGVIGGAVGVIALIIYYVLGADDIEDRKLEAARAVLDTLGGELRKGRPVSLDIDFRGYDQSLEDHWLTLKMTLENGVGVVLTASTHFKRKERSKRKYTKIKDKIHERISVTFSPPKGQLFDAAARERLPSLSPPSLRLRGVKVSSKAATFVFQTPDNLRMRLRGGWEESGLTSLVDGPRAVAAVITSYRALAAAGATGG